MDGHRSTVGEGRLRALCAGCCESFAADQLREGPGGRLCPSCSHLSELRPVEDAPTLGPPASAEAEGDDRAGGLRKDVERWCAEASWIPRLPLYALLVWWAFNHARDVEYQPVIDGLNFGIHELGHVLFAPLGMFLAIAGGTILQCLAPVVAGLMFLRQRDYFAVAFACGWLATNLFDVAVYVADARSQSLPLLGLGSGEPLHDWHWLLTKTGLLTSDAALAALLRAAGGAAFAVALGLGGWLLLRMALSGRSRAAR